MSRKRPPQPPALAKAMLARLAPERDREFLIGDFEESFAQQIDKGQDVRAARRWYWRMALATVISLRKQDRAWRPPALGAPKGDGVMKNIMRDVRHGLRLLRRAPGFTVVAVLTLALGIGANSAIFTVTYNVLLKPLPYSNPNELVLVSENNLSRGWRSFAVSPPNFVDWRAQSTAFAYLAAYGGASFNYSPSASGSAPQRLRGLAGTEGFIELLNGTTIRGRLFGEEDFKPGQERVAILNNGFWLREFGGRDVVNESITLNNLPYTIVGVMAPNWRFGGRDISVFVPRVFNAPQLQQRGAHFVSVVGRLKTGVTVEAARSELVTIASRLEAQYPDTNKGWSTNTTLLLDAAVGDFRPILAVLLGAVGLVLLVACANLANMHLARATGRAREMAIRAAIGAGRVRIVQQLLTESLVLSLVGGSLGLAVAYWSTKTFIAAYPTLLPRSGDIHIDARVMMFTAGLSILTAILFGLAPAISAARVGLIDTLRDGGRGGGGRVRRWLRSGLVVSEVALALVLLAGAGLLLKSFMRLTHVDPGFQTSHRLMAQTLLPNAKYAEPARIVEFYDRTVEGLSADPAVEAVALASTVPISGSDEIYSIELEGRPPLPPGQGISAIYYLVSPNYFQTMGIPVLKGRTFTDEDRDGAPRVAVINDIFAKLHFPNEDPLGKRIRMGRDSTIVREIVGVVASVKHYGLRDKDQAQMYEPFRQMPATGMMMVLKTKGDPVDLIPAVKRAVQKVDPNQPVANSLPLEQMLADSGALPRVQALLMGALSVIALALAAVGLYGVMAYSVSQRTQEIGIRMTLGARRSAVLGMVLRQAAGLTALGLAIGLAGAVLVGGALSKILEPMLFKVTPTDTGTLIGVAGTLGAVAILAAMVPARRATRISPIQALKSL